MAFKSFVVAAAAAVLLPACASTSNRQDAVPAPSGADTASYSAAVAEPSAEPVALDSRTIHFAYDSDSIDAAGMRIARQWAQSLSGSGRAVMLEGHADERGTPQYNQALGERRAMAVRRVLLTMGVSSDQLSLISYGEERPVATGHDEASWWQNRRVDMSE